MSATLKPGDTVGILGGGQLGRMLALAAAPLGLRCHIYCPDQQSPAFQVSDQHTIANYEDIAALAAFARSVDVVTYEFENIPTTALDHLSNHAVIRPGRMALEVSQDRLTEKRHIADLGIAVADHMAVSSLADLERAVGTIGRPSILKTRRLGYDGKGQVVIDRQIDLAMAWNQVGDQECILEARVPLTMEISVLAAGSPDGGIRCFDIGENRHENQILKTTVIPAAISQNLADEARAIGEAIIQSLDYVGVLSVELFVVDDGAPRLIVNEIAPRVHNSGHWTMDGCHVSQFEQHIRAIAGWPLGDQGRHSDVTMVNLIGDEVETWQNQLADPSAKLHLYGKGETRAGRKMGHVNLIKPNS